MSVPAHIYPGQISIFLPLTDFWRANFPIFCPCRILPGHFFRNFVFVGFCPGKLAKFLPACAPFCLLNFPLWTAAVKLQFIYFTAVVCIIGLILFIAALLSPDHPDHFPSKAAKIAERSKERHMLSNNEKETKTRFTDSILQTFRKGKILLTGYPS